jgi:hypothetical protein
MFKKGGDYMLLKLILIKEKRFFYKIKIKTQKDFIVAAAPRPKTLRQKQILINFLKPFENKIIYPENFYEKDYPLPYPAFEMHCKNLISSFLYLCKEKSPKIAVIIPNGLIKDSFYFDLSEYVGRIILITEEENNALKNNLIAHNGTVIEFNTSYDKNSPFVAILTMPKPKKSK